MSLLLPCQASLRLFALHSNVVARIRELSAERRIQMPDQLVYQCALISLFCYYLSVSCLLEIFLEFWKYFRLLSLEIVLTSSEFLNFHFINAYTHNISISVGSKMIKTTNTNYKLIIQT